MRSLEDRDLAECCNTIITEIKNLWRIYYADTANPINNYQTVDIPVPKQRNNHDCGFHMLLHAQYWDGRSICQFGEKDISSIRMIWTHKWLNYEENDAEWEAILNLV